MSLLWAVLAFVLVGLTASYLAWIAGRHERLAARADASWAALDAQLVRRAAPARLLATLRGEPEISALAERALHAGADREQAENALGRALRAAGYEQLTPAGQDQLVAQALTDLQVAAGRVLLARQFHNDAVRDLAALRRRPAARLLRLGRRDRSSRGYFEIDDTVLTAAPPPPR